MFPPLYAFSIIKVEKPWWWLKVPPTGGKNILCLGEEPCCGAMVLQKQNLCRNNGVKQLRAIATIVIINARLKNNRKGGL